MNLSWISIVRLGLVQMALGAIVVLMTSTLNRLMIVELALPAILPGFLVALHYGIQITRPNWGFRSDKGGRRTPWVITGMVILGLGGLIAAAAIPLMETQLTLGLIISILAYALIGLGVGASGTSLLALLATSTAPRRRAAAATITWLMMIAGIAITAGVTGALLEPYSHTLMLKIVASVAIIAVVITILAILGIEKQDTIIEEVEDMSFLEGIKEIWGEQKARSFSIFVFLSMTAYFMQELILEPYAGLVFGLTPGESTSLSGVQNGGVFLGMISVGILCTGLNLGNLRSWVIAGCIGSALSLALIAVLGLVGSQLQLTISVVSLGFFNGMFAVGAIGSMMSLAGQGRNGREGTRVGIWGAAQAIAAGFGGLLGASLVDLMRLILATDATAYGTVFLFEAALFIASSALAIKVMSARPMSVGLVPGE
ncbi:MAG: MFS transporter [Rhodobacteraceae bacterium]|nr:MFS transporter [Paracoccaceae bacterium]